MTFTKTIIINATASRVWRVLTEPELMVRWMSDADISVDSDWQVGGPISVRSAVNGEHEYKGFILQWVPERVFQYSSWSEIMRLPDSPEHYAVITFELSEQEGHTSLTITHSNLVSAASTEHVQFYWNGAAPVLKRLAEG
ncbi:hypothetical protein GVN16_24205 [Emticicia sp. CRIBPO]|uniref:SRPBCC family protein n=1 Tax=Emticicia sp. CRIBPO TaxID=2683258 RepID=UPI0014122095|nr:SRPBCC domain-containing protein [Emticicia sp. CRIBPO]NBA88900.1 hypothetical protein [Emticicia sp. CRIBPO]